MADLHLDDIAVFVRVLQRGGFAAAARELGVPTSTVSRTVARLEATVGARLLQRTTRAFGPTAEGREFFAAVSDSVAHLEQASRTVVMSSPTPHGRLRVTAPGDLGSTLVAEAVAEYVTRYPTVSVELELTARVVDLVAEGFDVAIRAGQLTDSSLVAKKIGLLQTIIVGSPAYLARREAPRAPADLAQHDLILFRAPGGHSIWTLRGPSGETAIEVTGRLAADDFSFVRAATLGGAGLALLPQVVCGADLREGRLVRLLEEYDSGGGTAYVVYPSSRQVAAKVAAFRDVVIEVYERSEATCRSASLQSERERTRDPLSNRR
jgi:DNA-binding transcriptional LysR family regulator